MFDSRRAYWESGVGTIGLPVFIDTAPDFTLDIFLLIRIIGGMSTVISDNEAKQNLAENVRRLLETRGMTQTQLAEAAHETQATISRIVNGLQLAGGGILVRLAEAFDVSVDRLLMAPPEETLADSQKSA